MKHITTILFLSFLFCLSAQDSYWVSYKNKLATKYSITKPEEFMNDKALARRLKFNIDINKTDLPVCSDYIKTIQSIGVEVRNQSKWLNGSLILTDDKSKVEQIRSLDFVKSIKKLNSQYSISNTNKLFVEQEKLVFNKTSEFDYGNALNQVEMLNGDEIHNLGFTGSNIEIAVMDNGFPSVDTNIYYQKAFDEGRIRIGYDFVNDNDTLFDSENGNHGNYVISTMVSFLEGEIIGTAPDATYYLFSTEDNTSEGLQEEYNWAMAAEMADTLMGPNAILSTSLGYSNGFNNSADEHTYADMNGNTTPITIAADLAASKGFLVINSAGNEGDNNWVYLTAPADGDSVLCVGAVNSEKKLVDFSSRGPSYDGRIKPNVCAKGRNVLGVSTDERLVSINGTSFSCPIISGMAACLWQAFPDKSNMEIFNAIEQSAHLYNSPNDSLGFGIPNFKTAYDLLKNEFGDNFILYPNPVKGSLNITIPKELKDRTLNVEIYDEVGHLHYTKEFFSDYFLEVLNIPINLANGTYFLNLSNEKNIFKTKFVKN